MQNYNDSPSSDSSGGLLAAATTGAIAGAIASKLFADVKREAADTGTPAVITNRPALMGSALLSREDVAARAARRLIAFPYLAMRTGFDNFIVDNKSDLDTITANILARLRGQNAGKNQPGSDPASMVLDDFTFAVRCCELAYDDVLIERGCKADSEGRIAKRTLIELLLAYPTDMLYNPGSYRTEMLTSLSVPVFEANCLTTGESPETTRYVAAKPAHATEGNGRLLAAGFSEFSVAAASEDHDPAILGEDIGDTRGEP